MLGIQGYFFSFGKTDHGFATWTYVAWLMPLLASPKSKPALWPLSLMQLVVAGAYLMAGIEKLLISGPGWVSAEGFRLHLQLHATKVGLWVATNDVLCLLLPLSVICWQLSFPVVLSGFGLRWLWLLFGLFFHIGTYLLMDIGGWVSPWWVLYMVFVPVIWPKTKREKLS
jgi:hypothetical protein